MKDCSAETPSPGVCPDGPGYLHDGGPDYLPPDGSCPCEAPADGATCSDEGACCPYLAVHCPQQIVGYQYEHSVWECQDGKWTATGQDCYDCCRPPLTSCGVVCPKDEYFLIKGCGMPAELCDVPPPTCAAMPATCGDCACMTQALGPAGIDVCAGAPPQCNYSTSGFDITCPAA